MENQPSKGKILIIDNKQVDDIIKAELINHNFQVFVANSGAKGIKIAELEKPDLILLESLMPRMDGFDTCRKLKTDAELKEIPVIFMSAHIEVYNKVKAFNLGAVDYITKPLNIEELIVRVSSQVSIFSLQKQLKNANSLLEQKGNEYTFELKSKNEELLVAKEEQRASYNAFREINEELSKQHADLQVAEEELKERHEELQTAEEELQATNEELIDTIESLHENEQRLNEAQKLAKLGHYNLNFATGYWTSSLELDRIFGIDEKFDRSVEGWVQIINTDYKQEMIEYFTHHVMQLHYKFNKEYKITNLKTKEDKWVHGLGELIFDSKGNLMNMLGTIQDITERKQVEILKNKAMEELEFERDLLHALMQNIPDTIYFKDVDSKFTRINNAQANMLGVKKPEDALGKTDFDFFDKNLAQEAFADEQKIVKSGNPIIDKLEMIARADGKIRWVSTTKVPIKNEKGKVISIVGVTRDITEHKKIELTLIENNKALHAAEEELMATNIELKSMIDKLGESETRFKALHNASFGGIAIHDKGLILECNLGLSELTGYQLDELIGMNGLLLISEKTRQMVTENIKSGYQKPYEALGIKKNGEEYPIRLEARNIPFRGKQVRVVEFRDITEQKKAEIKILENEHQLQLIFDNSPAIMVLINDKSEIVRINKTGIEFAQSDVNTILEQQPGSILKCIESVQLPDGCGSGQHCGNCTFRKIINDTIHNNIAFQKVEVELKLMINNSLENRFFLVSSITANVSENNTYLITIDDITDIKRVEEEIKHQEEHFRSIVENMPVLINAFDTDGNLIFWNKECENVTGYKAKEVLGSQDVLKKLYPDKNYKPEKNEKYFSDLTKVKNLEIELVNRKGEKRTIVWSNINKPVPLKNWALWEVGIEITKRKQALKALMESESRFKQLANFTQEGILVHKDGIIRDVNQAILNLTGYHEEELVGKHVGQFIPENYKKLVFESMIKLAEKPYEIEVIKKNLKTFPAQIFAIDFDSETERIRVVSIRDITEQKQVQQKILNAVIQTEENERTRVAQELHDGIGPILSTVKLYAQTYISSTDVVLKQKIETQLIAGIDDALSQVSDISNKLSPHVLKDFGLEVAIQKYINRVSKVTPIAINFDFNYKGEIDKAIETTLYRVAIELINNTIKHAKATKIDLLFDNANEFIQFIFINNGEKFDLEITKKAGSGMGLFNIENRIKSFNGQLSFEQGEDKGIVYNILLPAMLL